MMLALHDSADPKARRYMGRWPGRVGCGYPWSTYSNKWICVDALGTRAEMQNTYHCCADKGSLLA